MTLSQRETLAGDLPKVELVPIEKVKSMLLRGRILNAASIVALYRAIHYHEVRK